MKHLINKHGFTLTNLTSPLLLEDCSNFTIHNCHCVGGPNTIELLNCHEFTITDSSASNPVGVAPEGHPLILNSCSQGAIANFLAHSDQPSSDGVNNYDSHHIDYVNLKITGQRKASLSPDDVVDGWDKAVDLCIDGRDKKGRRLYKKTFGHPAPISSDLKFINLTCRGIGVLPNGLKITPLDDHAWPSITIASGKDIEFIETSPQYIRGYILVSGEWYKMRVLRVKIPQAWDVRWNKRWVLELERT